MRRIRSRRAHGQILILASLTVMAVLLTSASAFASTAAFTSPSGSYPLKMTGSSSLTWTLQGKQVSCSPATLEDEIVGTSGTMDATLSAPCYQGSTPRKLTEQECSAFIFRPETKTSPNNFDGTLELGPSGCAPVATLEYYNGSTICTASFAPQSGLKGVHFVNETEGATKVVRLTLNTSAAYTTSGNAFCPSSATATLQGEWVIKGTVGGGSAASVEVIDLTGLFVSKASGAAKLESPSYPAQIAGVEITPVWTTWEGGWTTTCEDVEMSGELPSAATSLALDAAYHGCLTKGWPFGKNRPTVIDMNSCHFVLEVLNAGPPYQGNAGIDCVVEGDGIEWRAYAGAKEVEEEKPYCTQTFGERKGVKEIGLENLGSGGGAELATSWNLTGLKATSGGGAFCEEGFVATYDSDITLFDLR